MSAFLEELRAALREAARPPEEIAGALAHTMTASAEYAREIKMPLDEFVALAVEAWAESHDRQVTQCEVVEEPDPALRGGPGVDVLIGMAIKWSVS